jgi:glucokinase
VPRLQGDDGHARGDAVAGRTVPPTSLAAISTDTVLALDIGGTKVAAGVVDAAGRLLRSASAPTPRGRDPEEVFAALSDAVEQVDRGDVLAIGVGCAGPMSAGGATVSPLNIPGWRDFPLLARLSGRYALPTVVDGDAKALAVGEGWCGAGAGLRSFLAMVVSTGVGGGIVVDGRLLDGASGNAGHVGHVLAVPDGAQCACGARGCLEAEISGTAIARRTGSGAASADAAEVERAGRLLGTSIGSVVTALDLEAVLVGGSVALGFGEPFFAAANAALRERCGLAYTRGCEIRPVGLGSDGPLVGAAGLAWRLLGHDVGVG